MQKEPVAILAAVAVLIVSLASVFGVVLNAGVVETLLVDVVIVVTAILQRSKVSPVAGKSN